MTEYVVHRFNGRIGDDAPAGRRGMEARIDLFGPKGNAKRNNPTDGIVLSAIPALRVYHMTVFTSMRPAKAWAEEAEDMGFVFDGAAPEAFLVTAPDLMGLAAKLRQRIAPEQGPIVVPAGSAWKPFGLFSPLRGAGALAHAHQGRPGLATVLRGRKGRYPQGCLPFFVPGLVLAPPDCCLAVAAEGAHDGSPARHI